MSRIPSRSLSWLAVAALAALPASGRAQARVTWLEPNGDVRSVAEASPSGPATTVVAGVELLPIALTNWYPQLMTRENLARWSKAEGIERVELPDNGRLLHYRRDGGRRWGWLWIRPDGGAEVVLELSGTGAGGRESPFAVPVAVGSDGRHAAVVSGAGTLHVLSLDPGRGSGEARARVPAVVRPRSLTVGRQYLFLQTDDDRLLRRTLRSGPAELVDITPPLGSGDGLEPEMAVSGDGNVIALVAGMGKKKHIWRVRGAGPPALVTARGTDMRPADYSTRTGGPSLLLSFNGSRLLCTERDGEGHHGNVFHGEFYLLDMEQAGRTLHITANRCFVDYIGTGIIPSFGDRDVAMPGEENPPLLMALGFPNEHDWYAIRRGAETMRNVTETNGQSRPPFEQGKLKPRVGCTLSNGHMIAVEDGDAGWRLRFLDRKGLASRIVEPVLLRLPRLGASLGDQAARIWASGAQGDAILSIDGMVPVYRAAPGAAATTSVIGAGDLYEVLVEHRGGTDVLVVLLPGGSTHHVPVPGLRRATATASGALVLDDGSLTLLQPGRGPAVLPAAAGSLALSGASTTR